MRDEDVAQTVLVGVAERAHRIGEVDDPPTGGVDVEYIGVNGSSLRAFDPPGRGPKPLPLAWARG